jgi:DNA-binding NtrC family response regulator
LKVLVIDDQASARRSLAGILARGGEIEIVEAADLAQAREAIGSDRFDVALIDLRLGPDPRNRDGLTLVTEINEKTAAVPIIVTASHEMAEIRTAMRLGAYDYILKDDLCDELVLPVLTELRTRKRLEGEVRRLRARQTPEPVAASLVGSSPAMEVLRDTIRRVALSDRPVLVVGPTGSGKELVVEAIHAQGPHPDEPLLDVNCGAIPETLMESHLFGHERGAFTGADRRQDGYLTLVREGTLFLDEIAELPLSLQTKLLRVMESGRFRAVGSPTISRFTGRVVAATHTALEERVAGKLFREDLFYRLNVLTVRVPSLEERTEDLPALVAHFTGRQPRPLRFTAPALHMLRLVPWPGNVRQLRNLIDRLAVFSESDTITPDILQGFLATGTATGASAEPSDPGVDNLVRAVLKLPVDNKLQAVEEALIAKAMSLCDGNKSAAARLLGVNRKAVERRVEKAASAHAASGPGPAADTDPSDPDDDDDPLT